MVSRSHLDKPGLHRRTFDINEIASIPDHMKKFSAFIRSILQSAPTSLPAWAGPLFIFLTCFFTFGVLLARLGYFQDDWHHVYYAFTEGSGGLMRFLFKDSRPLAFLIYVPFFKLLGFSPAAWHWSLMILRFLTVLIFWFCIRMLWPRLAGLATWLALFFAIYPAYPLQSLSVAYTLHWFLYLVFMISVFLMLRAARQPRSYLAHTLPAVLLQIIHLALIEYYSGLELVRLVFLWFSYRDLPFSLRWKKILKQWLPYFAVLILYAAYRVSYSRLFGYDRFSPTLLIDLLRTPLSGFRTFLQVILQDSLFVLISPWSAAFDPASIDLGRLSTFQILFSGVFFAYAAYAIVSRLDNKTEQDPTSTNQTIREVTLGGALALFFGLLPSWLAGLFLFSKNPMWSGRLALPALLGAGMIVTGLVYWLVGKPNHRNLVLAILLGVAVGFQGFTARDFQASWDKQLQFYWQLHWRVPALEPNTLIVSDAEILPYMGYYPTAYAINVLYNQATPATVDPSQAQSNPRYWFNAGSEHINANDFGQGLPQDFFKYSSTFLATKDQVLAITFEPQAQQCLWILRSEYKEVRFLSTEAYKWMDISHPGRIRQSGSETRPVQAIFGSEPFHAWCYYYQKADLAAQQSDWQTVSSLWKQAVKAGQNPGASVELVPFIEAFARAGDWDTARELTNRANVLPPRAPSLLCTLWKNIENNTPPGEKRDTTIIHVTEKLGCEKE